jgi:hypothetical protein
MDIQLIAGSEAVSLMRQLPFIPREILKRIKNNEEL